MMSIWWDFIVYEGGERLQDRKTTKVQYYTVHVGKWPQTRLFIGAKNIVDDIGCCSPGKPVVPSDQEIPTALVLIKQSNTHRRNSSIVIIATVRHRAGNRNPANRNHLEICLSSSQKNRNWLTWVLVALPVCPTSPLRLRDCRGIAYIDLSDRN